MANPFPWRQRLLFSLTGQLQLATYIVVFLGFSGASVASLWLNQRTLGLSTEDQLRANAKELESHLLAYRLLEVRPDEVLKRKSREKRPSARSYESTQLRWKASGSRNPMEH